MTRSRSKVVKRSDEEARLAELDTLNQQLTGMNARKKQLEASLKVSLAKRNGKPITTTGSYNGEAVTIEIRLTETKQGRLKKDELRAHVGDERYLEMAAVTLTAARDHLPNNEVEKFITYSPVKKLGIKRSPLKVKAK